MRLPPLTLREALALHQRILESGGDILALAADPDDLALHLMASLVSFGAQLARDKDVITELMAENAALQASVEELSRLLNAKIDNHMADLLEAHDEDPPLDWPIEDLTQPGAIVERSEADQTWLRALGVVLRPEDEVQVGDVQGVEWRGKAQDYFDHYEEINKELAKGISEMARQRLDDSIEGVSDAIEVAETNVETPGQDLKPEL